MTDVGIEHTLTAMPSVISKRKPQEYWQHIEGSYRHYPTIRHRWCYILRALRRFGMKSDATIFDFGCGEGSLLEKVRDAFDIPEEQMGGCDLSEHAVDLAHRKLPGARFFLSSMPDTSEKFDIILCCEVIEHAAQWRDVLKWISGHLRPGGMLVLTTQSGRIHASDTFVGHVRHFGLCDLQESLHAVGMEVMESRQWGFPFFSLQKWLSNFRFDAVRRNYLEGGMTLRKRVVFAVAYTLYFVHDWINAGPQLYLLAKK